MTVITLSTIPPRFRHIRPTLESLTRQKDKPDAIYLYIPETYRRFPDWDGVLPDVPEGIEIRRCAEDWGPATKVLAAVQEFQGQDVDILFCDDDQIYYPEWLGQFQDIKARHPSAVISILGFQTFTEYGGSRKRARRPLAVRRWRITDVRFQAHALFVDLKGWWQGEKLREPARRVFMRSGYVDVFEGRGGVLVRPDFFDEQAFDIPPVIWTVDDVWLSGMVARKGIPIWLEANLIDPGTTETERIEALVLSVVDGADRRAANTTAIEYMRKTYGLWL